MVVVLLKGEGRGEGSKDDGGRVEEENGGRGTRWRGGAREAGTGCLEGRQGFTFLTPTCLTL